MLRHIEKLRTKPKAVRIQAAFLGAVMVTGLVVLGWVATLPNQLYEIHAALAPSAEEEVTGRPLWQKFQVALGLTALPEISTSSEPVSNAAAAAVEAVLSASSTPTALQPTVSTTTSAPPVAQSATTSSTTATTSSTLQ